MCDQTSDTEAAQAINGFFDDLADVRMPHGVNWGHQTQVSEFRAHVLAAEGPSYLQAELLGYLSGLAVTGALSADQVTGFTEKIREFTRRGWL
jgi:hypothetical protein